MTFIQYTSITLKMILDSGLIKPDTLIYSSSQPVVEGRINDDGSITLRLDRQDKVFNSPSGAARAVVQLSVNGWTFWRFQMNGEFKELSFLRELYKSESMGE